MIVEPFSFDGYAVRDLQDVDPRMQLAIGRALRDGFDAMPRESKCDALGLTVDGDYLAIRFGLFVGGQLTGAMWMGGHVAAPRHAMENAKVYARLCLGLVAGREAESWRADLVVAFVKHLLTHMLPTREGGTFQLVGLDYVFSPDAVDDSLAAIVVEFDAAAVSDPELQVARTPLSAGGSDNRVTLLP